MTNLRMLIRIARPLQLILAAMTYILGAGIARYLGRAVDSLPFVLGFLVAGLIYIASSWLAEYFRLPLTPLQPGETSRSRDQNRALLLWVAYAAMTLAGGIAIGLFLADLMNGAAETLLLVITLFLVAYSLPPIHLSGRGYGEVLLAVLLGTLMPAWAFFLQYGEFHRLLTFATFPLTLLALAYLLVNNFPTFATDQKLGHHSLLTRLTWQRAIPIHHFLLLSAFLLFTISPFFGFPWRLVWPVFFALPFVALQIFWVQRISMGGRTLWNFITTLALASFGLSAYLLAFTFWTR
jgi:1,4-dihydroxy-2-naphthoate octaprenyltransferase